MSKEKELSQKKGVMGIPLEKEIKAAERAEGWYFEQLEVGQWLEVQTQESVYIIERRKDGFYISGNQKYCPDPVKAKIKGSTFGGSAIMPGFIGRGMYLEFSIPESHPSPIVTSRIKSIKVMSKAGKKDWVH